MCFGAEGALGALSWLQSVSGVIYVIASVAGMDLAVLHRFPWPVRRGFVTFLRKWYLQFSWRLRCPGSWEALVFLLILR